MVLGEITDGASRRLLDMYDEGTRRLILLLCLPIIDGVFPMLLVTGAIGTFSDVLAVSLTVFAGAGALAVLYSHAETVKEARNMVLKATPPLMLSVFAAAIVAPVFTELFYIERLSYATGLALLVIAGQLAGADIFEKLSVPTIIVTGMALSLRNPGAVEISLAYLAPALLTASVAVTALYLASYLLSKELKLSYIRVGGAVVLAMIAVSLFGYDMPSELGLTVFATSVVAALRA